MSTFHQTGSDRLREFVRMAGADVSRLNARDRTRYEKIESLIETEHEVMGAIDGVGAASRALSAAMTKWTAAKAEVEKDGLQS